MAQRKTRDLDTLKLEAERATRKRKHELGRWYPIGKGARAECLHCGYTVDVMVYPAPNQSSISGDAVGLSCPAYNVEYGCSVTVRDLVNLAMREHGQDEQEMLDHLVEYLDLRCYYDADDDLRVWLLGEHWTRTRKED